MWDYSEHSREVRQAGGVEAYKSAIALLNYKIGFNDGFIDGFNEGKSSMYPVVQKAYNFAYEKGEKNGRLEGVVIGVSVLLGVQIITYLIKKRDQKTKNVLETSENNPSECDATIEKEKSRKRPIKKSFKRRIENRT